MSAKLKETGSRNICSWPLAYERPIKYGRPKIVNRQNPIPKIEFLIRVRLFFEFVKEYL